jgi:phosphoserine aminotransferase
MVERIFNFSPGPAILPEPILEEARQDLWSIDDSGIGILEHSHRGATFKRVISEAEADCRDLAGISDDYAVLFLQGGASTQFYMLTANFLPTDRTADYLITGSWSKKAMKEARHCGAVHAACSSEDDNFSHIPEESETRYSEAPAYVHFTSNNTIFGTQFRSEPTPPGEAWLACDASSDIFSRPIRVDRYGLIYAGAQKNLGPSGVTLVILRRDLLERRVRELPSMLDYAIHAEGGSLYNTPPVFCVYVLGRVVRWLREQGGLAEMEKRNAEKASLIYDALEQSDFYAPTAAESSRSLMNITFRTPSEELDAKFVAEAAEQSLSGLKGHRSVGGMRASVYNAFPRAGCEVLVQFMKDFAAKNG